MRPTLIALSISAVLAVALLVQALFDSAVAAWVGLAAIFILAIGWILGLLPGGSSGLD